MNYTRVLRNICPSLSCEQKRQYEITVLLHLPPASALKRSLILLTHCVCVFCTILTVNSISIQNKQFVIAKKSVCLEVGTLFLYVIYLKFLVAVPYFRL
jgi:hypothetical protein